MKADNHLLLLACCTCYPAYRLFTALLVTCCV
jgi:hypothetical protein